MTSTTRRPDHPLIGRRVFCDEAPSRVLEVVDHAPWTHPHSPIYNALVARQFITHHCSRWTGLDARGREQITPRDLDAPLSRAATQ